MVLVQPDGGCLEDTPGKQIRPHKRMELTHPIILGGHLKEDTMPFDEYQSLAQSLGTYSLEELLALSLSRYFLPNAP